MFDYPEYWYYATVALWVLPSLLFNRQAIVVLAIFLLGFISPNMQIWAMVAGLVILAFMSKTSWHIGVAVLGGVLLTIATMDKINKILGEDFDLAVTLYWADYWTAMGRNLLLFCGNDWARMRAAARRGYRGYVEERTYYDSYRWQHEAYGRVLNAIDRFVRAGKSVILLGR